MEKVQIQFSILTEVMEALKAAAEKKGISPNILARLIMHEHFGQPDAESKSYTFKAKNWHELEAYVEKKRLGTVEVFAGFAIEQYRNRYPLSGGKKKKVEKIIGNTDKPRKAVQPDAL